MEKCEYLKPIEYLIEQDEIEGTWDVWVTYSEDPHEEINIASFVLKEDATEYVFIKSASKDFMYLDIQQ